MHKYRKQVEAQAQIAYWGLFCCAFGANGTISHEELLNFLGVGPFGDPADLYNIVLVEAGAVTALILAYLIALACNAWKRQFGDAAAKPPFALKWRLDVAVVALVIAVFLSQLLVIFLLNLVLGRAAGFYLGSLYSFAYMALFIAYSRQINLRIYKHLLRLHFRTKGHGGVPSEAS